MKPLKEALVHKHMDQESNHYKTYCMAVSHTPVENKLIAMGCEPFDFLNSYRVLFVPSQKLNQILDFMHKTDSRCTWWIAGTKENRKDTEDLLNKYGDQNISVFLDKVDGNIKVR